MSSSHRDQFINFLNQDLDIPCASIRLAIKKSGSSLNSLPMILWKYGFITLQQLDQIFDWLESGAVELI